MFEQTFQLSLIRSVVYISHGLGNLLIVDVSLGACVGEEGKDVGVGDPF